MREAIFPRTLGATLLALLLVATSFVLLTPAEQAGAFAPNGNCATAQNWQSFTFVFENGHSFTGDNCPGSDYATGSDGNSQDAFLPLTGGPTKALDGLGMTLHTSCSEVYEAGWGSEGNQPDVTDDSAWRLASYSIEKFHGTNPSHTQCGQPWDPGTIVVDKVTDPPGSLQSFGFDANWIDGSPDFSLTDSTTPWLMEVVPRDGFSVAELPVAGWDLTDASCVNSNGGDSFAATDFAVASGENVTCTFVNATEPPSSTDVVVSVTPDSCVWDGQESSSDVSVSIAPSSGASVTITGLSGSFGPYTVSTVVNLGPGDYSWTAVAAKGYDVVEPSSGEFTIRNCEPPPVCPAEGAIVVEFDGLKIRADLDESRAISGPVDVSIPAGVYDIWLASYDRRDEGDPTQAREQWFLEGLAADTVVFASPPISDLPDDKEYISELVQAGADVPALDAVRAYHDAYPAERRHSISPIWACLSPVEEPSGSISVYKWVDGPIEAELPLGPEFTFNLTGLDSRSVAADSWVPGTWSELPAGTYTLSETVLAGWGFVRSACRLDQQYLTDLVQAEVVSNLGNPVEINLAPGAHVICDFWNEEEPPPPPTPTPTPSELGSIGDLVWEDRNANDMQDPVEPGIEGVVVELFDADTDTLLGIRVTDAAGHYLFEDLEPGDYYLVFTLPSVDDHFIAPNVGGNPALDSDADNAVVVGRTTSIIKVVAGQDLTWDAGVAFVAVAGVQITTTTTVAVSPETLPFTGAELGEGGMAGIALALLALGGVALLSARRREDEIVAVAEAWTDLG